MLVNGPNGANGSHHTGSIFGEMPGRVYDPLARRMRSIEGLEHQIPNRLELENSPVGNRCRELQAQLQMGAATDADPVVQEFLQIYASREYLPALGEKRLTPDIVIDNFTRYYDRGMIVETLARLAPKNTELTEALCQAALRDNPLERECAIRVLAKAQKQTPRKHLLTDEQLSSFIPLLKEPALSDESFLSLAEITARSSSSPEVIPAIVQGFGRFNRFEVSEADTPRWIAPRGSQCLEHALSAVKRAPTALVLDTISAGLQSDNPRIFLGTSALVHAISERTIPEREQLLQGIYTMTKDRLTDVIKGSLISAKVKAAAIDTLGDFGMRASTLLPVVMEQTQSSNAEIKRACFRSIGRIGGATGEVIEFYLRQFSVVVGQEGIEASVLTPRRGKAKLVESLLQGVAACLPQDTAVHLMKIALLNRSPLVSAEAINVLKKAPMSWRTAEPLFQAAWDPSRLEDGTLGTNAESNVQYLINLAGLRFGREALPALFQLQHQLQDRLPRLEQFGLVWNRYNNALIATQNSTRVANLT